METWCLDNGRKPSCGWLAICVVCERAACCACLLLPAGGEDARVGGLRAEPDRCVERQRGGCSERCTAQGLYCYRPSGRSCAAANGSTFHFTSPDQATPSRLLMLSRAKEKQAPVLITMNANAAVKPFLSPSVINCCVF